MRDVAEEIQIAARDAIIRSTLVHARTFQRAILTAPPSVPGHDVDVAYRPLDEVGGDIYDVALVGNVVRVFIADATGHGVPAALVTMLIKSAYEFVKHSPRGPAWILKTLNDRIATAHGNLDVMCSAAVVDVDLSTRTIRHASAGHPPALLANGGNVEELESGGTFVGIEPGTTYPSWKRQLAQGEGLYLVTDGLAESRRASGEFFGDARLHRAVAEANELPTGVGDAIFARLESWLRPETQDDDVTILFLALNTSFRRHFEFVQQTWLNNPKFADLDERDPLVASIVDDGGQRYTLPADPARRRVMGLPRFVTLRGGAYFFIPGRRALDWLANRTQVR